MPESTQISPQLLVIEPDPALGPIFQDALGEMGYATTLASSLDQGLRLVHQQPFDLIITNTFPDTGLKALDSVRPLLALAHGLPVVLCTAWYVEETAVKQAGFAGLVLQPFDLEHLVTTMAECLNQPWTLDQTRQVEVVKRYTAAAYVDRDVEATLAFYTEDVQIFPWIVPLYPFARPVRGRADAHIYVQEQKKYFSAYEVELVHLSPCPSGVAIRLRCRWRDPSGAPRQQVVAHCLHVTPDGLISQSGIAPPDDHLVARLSHLRGS